jgi:hypothetical protein
MDERGVIQYESELGKPVSNSHVDTTVSVFIYLSNYSQAEKSGALIKFQFAVRQVR